MIVPALDDSKYEWRPGGSVIAAMTSRLLPAVSGCVL